MTEREQFERWWDESDDIANDGPWQHDTPIQFAWAAWQAARAQPQADALTFDAAMPPEVAEWLSAHPPKTMVPQAGAEPVAWMYFDSDGDAIFGHPNGYRTDDAVPVYTHPPAHRVALSDARWQYINDRVVQMSTSKYEALCSLLHIDVDDETFDLGAAVDEAIERAHGIGGGK